MLATENTSCRRKIGEEIEGETDRERWGGWRCGGVGCGGVWGENCCYVTTTNLIR